VSIPHTYLGIGPTTAVGLARDPNGKWQVLVGSSEGALRKMQFLSLQANEQEVRGQPRTHAEVNVLNGARDQGMTLFFIAPSRSACPACQYTMAANNVIIINPK
jgi:hypothetical protein